MKPFFLEGRQTERSEKYDAYRFALDLKAPCPYGHYDKISYKACSERVLKEQKLYPLKSYGKGSVITYTIRAHYCKISNVIKYLSKFNCFKIRLSRYVKVLLISFTCLLIKVKKKLGFRHQNWLRLYVA